MYVCLFAAHRNMLSSSRAYSGRSLHVSLNTLNLCITELHLEIVTLMLMSIAACRVN